MFTPFVWFFSCYLPACLFRNFTFKCSTSKCLMSFTWNSVLGSIIKLDKNTNYFVWDYKMSFLRTRTISRTTLLYSLLYIWCAIHKKTTTTATTTKRNKKANKQNTVLFSCLGNWKSFLRLVRGLHHACVRHYSHD